MSQKDKEKSHLWLAIWITISLAIYELLIQLITTQSTFFDPYIRLPVVQWITRLLFFWVLALLWIAYRRWCQAIRRKRELETIISSVAPDVFIVIKPDRTITMCNVAKMMFGYESSEIIGQKTDLLYFDRQSQGKKLKIHDHLERMGFHVGYATGKRRDGETFPLEIITGRMREGSGAVILLRDITEMRRLENQLRKAQKMEAIGLMAGGVAHDLNNILSGIVGYPELMLQDLPQDSELRKPIEAIQESGKRAITVVADLLTVARGAATTREVHNLNSLIQEYLNSPECNKLKSLYPKITYEHRFSVIHPNIFCSPVHVKKCIMNLITNAAESIIDGGTVVVSTHNQNIDETASAKHKMEVGEYIVLSVQDTGPGISNTDLEHIFEPFYTKKVMGRSGTGLGLTVVWNTMEDHGGKILVESNEKRTRFQLYFPVSKEEYIDHTENDRAEELTGNSERILVVDDDPQLRNIDSQMLRPLGYKVDSVCSGEMAIEFVKKNPVDLIVMDMLMEPGLNGRQTYEEILKLYPDQKAIITSGFSESDDVKATLQLGAGGFIIKPYSMAQLGRAVKEALIN